MAKEFNVSKEEGIFAATPPIEALRMIVSGAATTEVGSPKEKLL